MIFDNIPHDTLTAWIFWILVLNTLLNPIYCMLILRKMKKRELNLVKKWEKKTKKPEPAKRIPKLPGQDPDQKKKDETPKAWKEEKFE